VNAEFNVWLLIVGLVVGAGLVWLVVLDSRRRESEIDEAERLGEAAWLSAVLAEEGVKVSPDTADRMLTLHRAYLEAPPPDDPLDGLLALDHQAPDRAAGSEPAEEDRLGLDSRA